MELKPITISFSQSNSDVANMLSGGSSRKANTYANVLDFTKNIKIK